MEIKRAYKVKSWQWNSVKDGNEKRKKDTCTRIYE